MFIFGFGSSGNNKDNDNSNTQEPVAYLVQCTNAGCPVMPPEYDRTFEERWPPEGDDYECMVCGDSWEDLRVIPLYAEPNRLRDMVDYLVRQLKRFGDHKMSCNAWGPNAAREEYCDCGLMDAIGKGEEAL